MLRKAVKLVAFLFCILLCYSLYTLPVFLEYGGAHCLHDERKEGYHSDYLWGKLRVKWKYTVVCGINPPIKKAGSQDYFQGAGQHPKPIPLPGQWQWSYTIAKTSWWSVRMHYFAYTNKSMYHTRLGWRWDDLDDFFLFSYVGAKKLPYNWERILWFRNVG